MHASPNTAGHFIMLDGIDGSGKSTVIDTWATALETAGKRVFSLKSYWKKHGTHPTPADAMDYDVIISAEPTYVWIGAAIREEMIRVGHAYSPKSIAEAYALDRLLLYTRFLLPLRTAGKLIIQDRGISTSLCYQSITTELSMADIAAIEGNAFALTHAPDTLVLTHITPEHAMERIGQRSDKQDHAIFEQHAFLKAAHATFHSSAYQSYFLNRGTTISVLDTDCPITDMRERAAQMLNSIAD